jgi:solute:Na+ symporter, SSS family
VGSPGRDDLGMTVITNPFFYQPRTAFETADVQQVDYFVLLVYLAGVVAVGVVLAARNKTTAEMFTAGGQSPWWVAGLSGFMTMFSAGTFVVWGGIAYKHGMVAVAINLCYGLAAILVGWTVAGRWKESGIKTPAEYVEFRFGKAALHFYTWAILTFKVIGSAIALYSLCVLMVAMMPLGEGNPLRDVATGNMSLNVAIVILGGVVVFYTMIGGLWGVLMTDVLQFIILNLAVLFVVPLALSSIGGIEQFFAQAPPGFWAPTGGGYSWFFLLGWVAIHYFVVGAEWAFVQRYLCVPSPADARKGAYLFGGLYLLSPWLWLLPPIVQRIRAPIPSGASREVVNTLGENAYIEICQAVLPAGMLGLVLAAMFSATASMVSSQLNVFAGVLTNDILKPCLKNVQSERMLVWFGRGLTVLIGIAIVGAALLVPRMGGAEDVIVSATSLMVGPLLAPLLIGLISKKLPSSVVWITAAVCCGCILMVKVVLPRHGLASSAWTPFAEWIQDQGQTTDIILGALLPIAVAFLCLGLAREVAPGWNRIAALPSTLGPAVEVTASKAPTIIVGWSLTVCGAMMAGLAMWSENDKGLLALFALMLFVLAGCAFYLASKFHASKNKDLENADIG